ncbi:hypothetical protein PENTCL1PPCAC_11001, partial [Pristionchus entomophagus]
LGRCIESLRLSEMLLRLFDNALHLELICELENVQHRAIRDLHRSKVDQVQEIEEFLINDILDLNFILSLLSDFSKEHSSENGRVDSKLPPSILSLCSLQ